VAPRAARAASPTLPPAEPLLPPAQVLDADAL